MARGMAIPPPPPQVRSRLVKRRYGRGLKVKTAPVAAIPVNPYFFVEIGGTCHSDITHSGLLMS